MRSISLQSAEMKRLVPHDAGFTLVELFVVVAIIGVLAAIALPRIAQAIETAKQGRTVARLNSIRAASRLYFSDHMDGEGSYYPYSLNEITKCNIAAHASRPHSYLFPDGEGSSDLPPEEVGDGLQPGDQITDWCVLDHSWHTSRSVQTADKGGWNWCGGSGAGTGAGQFLPSGNAWIDENVMLFSGNNANEI
jgi:prepilin-type N-terminal cleavage/methylation domain-containing protein